MWPPPPISISVKLSSSSSSSTSSPSLHRIMYKVLFLSILVLGSSVATAATSSKHQVHKRMSIDDLRRTFQVDSHEKVPEYDIVHVRPVSRRAIESPGAKRIYISPFGRQMELNLERNTELQDRLKNMKVIMAETAGGGKLKYKEAPLQSPQEDVGTVYQDSNTFTAVVISHNEKGQVQMDGTIGNDLVIRPIPNEAASETDDAYVDDEMFLDEDEMEEMKKRNRTRSKKIDGIADVIKDVNSTSHATTPHVVFRRKPSETEAESDFLELEPARASRNSSLHSRRKRQAPEVVWPEVLLVVDYDTFLLHGANSRDIKRYFVSFWNGVDLRYKLLSHPKIRISLAGMIVAKDRDATPYLERNRLRAPNDDAIDAAGALTDMGKYLYRENRLPTYDLAVVITKLDMCRRRFEGGRCNRGTAGFAYVGGACVVNKRLEKVNSVAIIEDSGGFSGIIVAAHEVGHLLGCVHDGSPPPSYLGGPGATRCPWEDGFIMSDLRHTERGFRWSSCSVDQFKHFLNGETASCLYNFPHENELLPRILPGTMMTLDEQCKRDRGTTACFKDSRVCAQLFCFDSASGYCVSYRPAAEGSTCGDGQVCRNGKCVAEIENIIPDYTHVTQTVISRPLTSSQDTLVSRSDSAEDPPRRGPPFGRPAQRRGAGRGTPAYSPRSPSSPAPKGRGGKVLRGCEDSVQQLAGGLSCTEFIERFGYRYCKNNYIKRNCCASHAILCNDR